MALMPEESGSDHSRGRINAPLVLVEYGDYECGGCGDAYHALKRLRASFGMDFRLLIRNVPLKRAHPRGVSATPMFFINGQRDNGGPEGVSLEAALRSHLRPMRGP